MGLIRFSTALSSSVAPSGRPVTYCEMMTMMMIGTMNASTTTTTSCFQFLIGETC